MKPLSMYGVAVAAALVILCTSFTSDKAIAPEASPSVVAAQNTHYYFYLADGDTYEGYNTISQEIADLESIYDVYVDTNSLGGTLLASGYVLFGLPHLIWPSSLLYGHY